MPRASTNVLATDREVKAATSRGMPRVDYRIRGAPGLQLRVTERGTKSWALAYKSPATGKWSKSALGEYDRVGLAEAKAKAADLAAEVRKGHDPVHDKRQEALSETFGQLAARYQREHETRNARAGQPSASTLENARQLAADILPAIGRMKADSVSRQHVMHVVEVIADRGSYVAADRALGLIRAIYNWACGTGRMERNPTIGLKKRNTGRPKTRVLSAGEIRAFWAHVEALDGITPALRDAYRLQLLTATRIGEVLGAPRAELDLDRGLWTIPANRTKADREHVLPLSSAAVAIWRAAIVRADGEARQRAERIGRAVERSSWVFPSPTGRGPIDPHAATTGILRMRAALVGAGLAEPFNTHDLRRTVATQLGEMGVADELIERILNHAPRTVAGKHYNHARYLGPMRQALAAWALRLGEITQQDSNGRAHE